MAQASFNPHWFVRKDLDGFFGLMIDNLIQLILIVGLCRELIHLPDDYIFGRILPGAAISILVGNFFYAWQARQLAHAPTVALCLAHNARQASILGDEARLAHCVEELHAVTQEHGYPLWSALATFRRKIQGSSACNFGSRMGLRAAVSLARQGPVLARIEQEMQDADVDEDAPAQAQGEISYFSKRRYSAARLRPSDSATFVILPP